MVNWLAILLLAGCLQMKTVSIQPVSDAVAQWSQFPNDAGVHALKVDDGFSAPDNDTTYIYKNAPGGANEILTLDSLPSDFKQSIAVRLRSWVWSSHIDNTIAFAVYVDGVAYGDPDAIATFTAGTLNQWVSFQVQVTDVPSLYGSEVLQLFPISTTDSGEVRITQMELEIDYINHLGAQGTSVSQSPKASAADLIGLQRTLASLSPKASVASLSPSATLASLSPKGSGE